MEDGHVKEFQKESDVGKGPKSIFKMTFRPVMRRLFLPGWIDGEPCGSPTSALFELKQDLHLLTQSQTSTSCQKSSRTAEGEAERLGTGGLWCQGGPETEAGDQGPAAPDQRNVFLERRRAGRGAVNLEDDHHSTNKDWKPGLWLRRADGGAKTLEDDITLPTRILTHLS
ncbi:unnamed protein product [Boreogadus saida]